MKERELEDKLVKNLGYIERGLILIERQKKVNTGIIDLYCKDKKGNHVIVEVKLKPDTKVIAQLAKYKMSLIKSGIREHRLRTILVAGELPKNVKEICEFFNFEIKSLSKVGIRIKRESKLGKSGIPSVDELLRFIRKRNFVNFSMIARFYNINNATVSDIVDDLEKRKLVKLTRIGGNKVVMLNGKKRSER